MPQPAGAPPSHATRRPRRRPHPAAALVGALLALAVLLPASPVVADPGAGDGLDRTPLDLPALDVPGAIPGELLVTYRSGEALRRHVRGGFQAVSGGGAGQTTAIADRVGLVRTAASWTTSLARSLSADPDVVAVEPNVRRSFSAAPDDPSYVHQWAHEQTGAARAWDTFTGAGPDQTRPLIAILDSGVDATHPDLQGIVVQSLRSAGGEILPGAAMNDPCGIGHGTAVTGSAAAAGDNGVGLAGALWGARIIDIALTSPENGCPGGPSDADTITAMHHVTGLAEKPLAMNLSLGASASGCSLAYQAAADQARQAGIAVVAAAGNDGSARTSIPASCDGVISVGASTASGGLASYSQTNPQIDIAAPGGDIEGQLTSCPTFAELVEQFVVTTALEDVNTSIGGCPAYVDPHGDRLQGISGTSFSTPYVTAAIGLIRQLAADRGAPLSVDQAEAIIEATAADAGEPGRDCQFGWGLLDLAAAVDAVVAGTAPALQADPPIGTGSCSGVPVESPSFTRIAAGSAGATDPVDQAVATSAFLPAASAPYAVLARVDDFADALSGSALGLGIGPLLYTASTGGLDSRTESELLRVLDFDGGRVPWVYLMGGTSAIPTAVDQRLQELGIEPRRIAGEGREATAVAASAEVEALKAGVPFATRDHAFVAFGRDYPDAVAAGSMAAYYGIPVLVTNTASLHPATRAELQRLRPERVTVLGGTAAISDAVVAEIRDLGLDVQRLSGPTRVETALAVADAYVAELVADGATTPPAAVAVNLSAGFADVLSASLIGGNGNLFMPLVGDGGTVLTSGVADAFCGLGSATLVIGGRDVISDAAAAAAAGVVDGSRC